MQRKLSLAVVVLLLVACGATFKTNAYRTLSTAATTYEASMSSIADLYNQGLVGEDVKEKAIELGSVYWSAYHVSVSMLESYEKRQATKDDVEKALLMTSDALSAFVDYVGPILKRFAEEA